MADQPNAAPPAQKRMAGANPLFFVVALALLGGLFFLSQGPRGVSLNRSAIGFDGLPLWLAENEIEARSFYGRAVLDDEDVSLRILPLYDVNLGSDKHDTNDDEPAMAETDRDIEHWVVHGKIRRQPTLLVMPKWRAGVREFGALHPELLISSRSQVGLLAELRGNIGQNLHRQTERTGVTGSTPAGEQYVLHYPQTLMDSGCVPLIGSQSEMLLGRCTLDDTPFWLLTDPDLLNNHGLSQGDNAETALTLIPSLGDDTGEIVLDLTTSIWIRALGGGARPWDGNPRNRYRRNQEQRKWSDLARFFEYPFSVIWWSFACLSALVFWRAWRRYGAADARTDEEGGPRASRLVSMDTKARLLRLTGRDDALVQTFIDARLESLADDILGAHRQRGKDGQNSMMAAISRRSPELANEFTPFRANAFNSDTAQDILVRHVAALDELIERTLNEFGRPRHNR